MAQLELSDKQVADTNKIANVQLRDGRLLVVYQDHTGLSVSGSGIDHDADLLEQIRDQDRLHYLVFRDPKSKLTHN